MELTERGARFLLVLMAVLGVLAFVLVRPFLAYLVLGLVSAFVLRPPYKWLARHVRRESLAAWAMVIVTLIAIVAPFVFLAFSLADEALELGATLADRGVGGQLRDLLARVGLPEETAAEIAALAAASLQDAASRLAQDAIPNIAYFFVGMFVFFFALYFGLVQGEDMLAFIRRAAPLHGPRMNRLLEESGRAVDAIFRGEILVALIQGSVAGVGWWLFGYPDPVFWGFVAVILSILPWVGAPLLIVPVGLYTALTGEPLRGVGFALFGFVLVGFIDNLLRPYIIGRRGKIHPAIVLVGVVGGIAAFGIEGLFLGPLILVLLLAVVRVWSEAEGARE